MAQKVEDIYAEGVLADGTPNTIRIPGDDDYSFGYSCISKF